jgi:hypothetical protein
MQRHDGVSATPPVDLSLVTNPQSTRRIGRDEDGITHLAKTRPAILHIISFHTLSRSSLSLGFPL